eukprot:scaffold1879_cov178-Amphora_coffeaeformis.AAC.8
MEEEIPKEGSGAEDTTPGRTKILRQVSFAKENDTAAPPETQAEQNPSSVAPETATATTEESAPTKDISGNFQSMLQSLLQHPYTTQFGIPVGAFVLYIFLSHPLWLWTWITLFLSRIVAWAIGIALGAGWAMHVYEQLDLMASRQREQDNIAVEQLLTPTPKARRGISNVSVTPARPILSASPSSNLLSLEDEQTYTSLMQAAGYPVDKILRGQVCKAGDAFWQTNYPFEHGTRALQLMQTLFPSLPECIRIELTKFMEHIMRDFVSSWYSLLDSSVSYQEERAKRAAAAAQQQSTTNTSEHPPQRSRRMVYQMAAHRKAPFMEKLYETLTVAFGNLATRVEHVNVLELALLKWTKILAHTFKTYRHLRRIRLGKQHANATLTEMDVTKEFLFAGKLHKAVTFGLDVPALLFADAAGKECQVEGLTYDNKRNALKNENAVLEARLFKSGILRECELDYNRVVAYRIVRALLPRADFGSPLVSSLVTEIMASCVLTPLMACFCPDYLNSWIMAGLAESATTQTATEDTAPSNPLNDSAIPNEPAMAANANTNGRLRKDLTTDPLMGSLEERHRGGVDASMKSIPEGRTAGTSFDANEIIQASSSMGANTSDFLVSQLTQVLIDLQDYMDLPEMREARKENRQGPAVDWDDGGCRAVILRLVLVLEAALMNGRCTYRVRNASRMLPDAEEDDEVDMDDSDRPVEVTLNQYESTTFSQLLMELTSDIEAFEERVATENTIEADGGLEDQLGDSSDHQTEVYKPTGIEQSTLRTLIAAWLHTGQVYRTMTVLMQAHATVLAPYYRGRAFLRSRSDANDFLKVLQALDGIDILVDTMSIMNSPRLDEVVANENGDMSALLRQSPLRPTHQRSDSEQSIDTVAITNSLSIGSSFMSNASTPRHLDFHRNEAFAASLRSERDRRTQSWYSLFEGSVEEGVPIICHSRGVTDNDAGIHRELHHLARIFYSGTNLITIRNAARRNSADDKAPSSPGSSTSSSPVSLLTVEMASPRRRIEVPDDDSSFLLRAQPRPLNAVGVHRDQRNHDQSFKCFAGTYEEPALSTEHFSGGRYLRYCM